MGPGHVEAGEAEGDEDVAERFADDAKAEERGQEVGEDGVKEVVEHAQAETSPSSAEAANAVEMADGGCDLGCDWLVLDNSDFDVGVSLDGHERLFLEWRVWLVGVCWWLGLDDGGAGWRLDHGEGGHDLTEGVVDL